jgi:hypothetical protein
MTTMRISLDAGRRAMFGAGAGTVLMLASVAGAQALSTGTIQACVNTETRVLPGPMGPIGLTGPVGP